MPDKAEVEIGAMTARTPGRVPSPTVPVRPDLWKPRLEEAPQCASCPFRGGNDAEFGTVVARLLGKKKATKAQISRARDNVQYDVVMQMRPDFACHVTAYNADMSVKPLSEHRQCPGATVAFRMACGLVLDKGSKKHG